MILDLPIPPPYRLVSVQQVRRKSNKGWLQIEWAVALCVDRPTEECGVNYGFGQAATVASATAIAIRQSEHRQRQDTHTERSTIDLTDLVI